jgi:hypothetical protein
MCVRCRFFQVVKEYEILRCRLCKIMHIRICLTAHTAGLLVAENVLYETSK